MKTQLRFSSAVGVGGSASSSRAKITPRDSRWPGLSAGSGHCLYRDLVLDCILAMWCDDQRTEMIAEEFGVTWGRDEEAFARWLVDSTAKMDLNLLVLFGRLLADGRHEL
jgi:hypothetical protein